MPDEMVVFHALGNAHIANIARIQLAGLQARLAKRDLILTVSEAALAEVARIVATHFGVPDRKL